MILEEDCIVTPGSVQPTETEAAQDLRQQFKEMQARVRKLDQARCGALIAGLFARYPELASFNLMLWIEASHDGEGCVEELIYGDVTSVKSLADEEPLGEPDAEDEEELDLDDGLDADALRDEILVVLRTRFRWIFELLTEGRGAPQLELSFDAKDLAELLATGEPISGSAAFDCLLLEYL